jgi:hypothetical protein
MEAALARLVWLRAKRSLLKLKPSSFSRTTGTASNGTEKVGDANKLSMMSPELPYPYDAWPEKAAIDVIGNFL